MHSGSLEWTKAVELALGGKAALQRALDGQQPPPPGGNTSDRADFAVGQFAVATDATATGNDLMPSGAAPAWLDNGSIVEPGLYVASVEMAAEAGSSPGVHVSAKGPFGGEWIVSLDGMAALDPGAQGATALPDIGALGVADVPFAVVGTIQMEDAAAAGGWVCAFRLRAARLVAA